MIHTATSRSAALAAAEAVRSRSVGERRVRLAQLVSITHASERLASIERVLAVSDLHADNIENWEWLSKLPEQPGALLLVAVPGHCEAPNQPLNQLAHQPSNPPACQAANQFCQAANQGCQAAYHFRQVANQF